MCNYISVRLSSRLSVFLFPLTPGDRRNAFVWMWFLPSTEQANGFSPVWRRWCVLSCPLWQNALLHPGKSHAYGRSPATQNHQSYFHLNRSLVVKFTSSSDNDVPLFRVSSAISSQSKTKTKNNNNKKDLPKKKKKKRHAGHSKRKKFSHTHRKELGHTHTHTHTHILHSTNREADDVRIEQTGSRRKWCN